MAKNIKKLLEDAEPFHGSDTSWKKKYGKNWKEKKQQYFNRLQKLHNKALKKHS